MPKRTNDFQALIALVERQLAASGVRVVESEMLADIAMPDGIELVLPSGDSRFLDRIELEIAFDRERSHTKFDRKIYGDAGLSFASKTYTRGEEKAHFVFSMLQRGDETSAAAAVRTSDGRSDFVLSPRVKSRTPPSGTQQSD